MPRAKVWLRIDASLLQWLDDTFTDKPRSYIPCELMSSVRLLMERGHTYEEILHYMMEL